MFVWKSFLNYYNFAKYSYRFCYIWSSCDFLGLSNHTQVIAIQANQVKSPSYIVQVKSQRALKSPNHWEWWLSSDSNHKSLESLWLGTNSARSIFKRVTFSGWSTLLDKPAQHYYCIGIVGHVHQFYRYMSVDGLKHKNSIWSSIHRYKYRIEQWQIWGTRHQPKTPW